MSPLLLIFIVSVANFALGFGLASHLGYGPDWLPRSLFTREATAEPLPTNEKK
ncbi:MAG: hypothetical protein SFU86_03425 [Pirellulaceae bacterium]|nr:hypothetical protein [Pirellulaceae bacterium]